MMSTRLYNSVLFCTTLALACGGCSKFTSSLSSAHTVSGIISAGPITGSAVKAYSLKDDGTLGTLLGSTTSGANGTFTFNLAAHSGAVAIVASGGSYKEEASGSTISMGSAQIRTLLSSTTDGQQVGVTPVTEIAAQNALAAIGANGTTTLASIIESSNTSVASAMGLTDITLPPANPTQMASSAANTRAAQYAVVLATISQMAMTATSSAGATINSLDMMQALATSFTFNGNFNATVGSSTSIPVSNASNVSVNLATVLSAVGGSGATFSAAMQSAMTAYVATPTATNLGFANATVVPPPTFQNIPTQSSDLPTLYLPDVPSSLPSTTPTIAGPPPIPSTSQLPRVANLDYSLSTGTIGVVGTAMSIKPSSLSANGNAITACAIKATTTALPTTLTVAPTTCVISGTPTSALAATTYLLVATNSAGTSVAAPVTLTINSYNTVGGSVSGLNGTLVLQDNGGDNKTISANGAFTFAKTLLTATNYSVSILSQPSGQVCSLTGQAGTMVNSAISSVSVTCAALWGLTVQVGTTSGNTYGASVATDSSGNVYVTGNTSVAIDSQTRHGALDFFITKYNSSGAHQWTVQDGGSSGFSYGMGIAVDSSGNVYVSGYTTVALDSQTQHGANDFFITKYDTDGTQQWTVQDGGSGQQSSVAFAIALDSSANVFVSGRTTGALDSQTQHGSNDLFITKYDSSGTRKWTVQDGAANGNTYGYGIATDSSGNVYATGYTTVAIDGQTQMGSQDLFISKLNSSGVRQWTTQDGASGGNTWGQSVVVDSTGKIYIAGGTNIALDGQTKQGSDDFITTMYNSNGVRQWTVQDGAFGGHSTAFGIALDGSGDVLVTGKTSVALDGQTQHGAYDLFVAKFNASGVRQLTVQDGASGGTTNGAGIALDSSGHVYVTGGTSAAIEGQSMHGLNDLFFTQYTSAL